MTSVLIVDDRAEVRDVLSTLLRYRDYKVSEAADGDEALALARRQPPDLVVSDILMPRMDGYQFVRELREDPRLARVPVIFNTAHFLGREAAALAQRLGVEHIITKPNEPETVYATIARALGTAPAPATPVQDGELDREHLLVLTQGLRQQADELRSAHERMAGLLALARTLSGELETARALEEACSAGRKLIGARYMLAIVRKGETATTSLVGAAGLETSDVGAFAKYSPRNGRMAELYENCPFLRLSGLTGDAVSYGLPPGFPRVSSLLAVPIHIGGRTAGWICAAEKLGLNAFGAVDTEVALAISGVLGRVMTCISMSDDLRRRTRELEAEVYSHMATEAALRQSERRLRDLTEGISDWVWETGPDLTFTYLSGGARAEAVIERQRYLGKRREDGAAEPTDTPAWKKHLEDLAARRPFRDFTFRIWDPNGNIRVVRTSGQPMFDESGAFRGYHGIAVDVTAQTALEERQAELERRALQSAHLESLGTFAGGIAHDINNLLIPITALGSNVLEQLGPSDRHREELERIVDAGDAIASLVRQVLTFCRSDVQPLHPIRIADVLEKSGALLRSTLPRNVKFTLELDPATGAIEGDESAILQVILNLCMNAADAVGDKSGHVSLSLASVPMEAAEMAHPSPSGKYARLSVQDNGCGMDQATQDRIFEPFFTTKAVGKGTGIGMSVVHGIVTSHRGTIVIESRPGKGTRFDIYFPLIASEGAA